MQQGDGGKKPRTAYNTVGQGRRGSLLPRILGPRFIGQLGNYPVCARKKLVQMGRSSLKLSGLGSGPALRATYRYKVTLTRTDGQTVELVAHGLETIASNLDAIDPRILRQAFPEVPEGGLEGASGWVSLLIGQDNLRLFPVQVAVRYRMDGVRECRRNQDTIEPRERDRRRRPSACGSRKQELSDRGVPLS